MHDGRTSHWVTMLRHVCRGARGTGADANDPDTITSSPSASAAALLSRQLTPSRASDGSNSRTSETGTASRRRRVSVSGILGLAPDPVHTSARTTSRNSGPEGGHQVLAHQIALLHEDVARLMPLLSLEDTVKSRLTQLEAAMLKLTSAIERKGGGMPGLGARTARASLGPQAMASQDVASTSWAEDAQARATSAKHGSSIEAQAESAMFTELRALVDTDDGIRSQLKDLRSAISRTALKGSEPNGARQRLRDLARPWDARRLRWRSCAAALVGPILHPEGRFRSGWNAILALLILYCGWAVPLEIAFEDDMALAMCGEVARSQCSSWQVWFWFNTIIDIWFICDIVVNLRTGYITDALFIKDDWKVVKHYMRGSFAFDLMGSFPVNFVILASNSNDDQGSSFARTNKLLRMLRLLKLTKLIRMVKLVSYFECAAPLLAQASIGRAHVHGRRYPPSYPAGTSRSSCASIRGCCASSSSSSSRSSAATGLAACGGSSRTLRWMS